MKKIIETNYSAPEMKVIEVELEGAFLQVASPGGYNPQNSANVDSDWTVGNI